MFSMSCGKQIVQRTHLWYRSCGVCPIKSYLYPEVDGWLVDFLQAVVGRHPHRYWLQGGRQVSSASLEAFHIIQEDVYTAVTGCNQQHQQLNIHTLPVLWVIIKQKQWRLLPTVFPITKQSFSKDKRLRVHFYWPWHPLLATRMYLGRHLSHRAPVTPGRHWHRPVTRSQVMAPSSSHSQAVIEQVDSY